MNNSSERNIPLPIQREVRKRCGFGCVICGFPLYEYDHLKEWAIVREHKAEDITLLCDKHHKEVTTGLLPRTKVVEANKNPFNLREGKSSEMFLHFEGNSCEVHIGGNSFTTETNGEYSESIPVLIDGIPIVAFILQDNQLLLNVNIFDEFNQIVMRIVNNELSYTTSPWDIQLVGTTLTIREKVRKFLLRIKFEPPNKIFIEKARLLCNGVEILVNEDSVLITNNNTLIRGCIANNCHGGLIIGGKPISGFMYIGQVPRYLGDSKKSIEWSKSLD